MGRSIIEFFTFSSPGIRNYLRLFTGSILDVLEIILWQSLCDTIRLSLYRDSVTVQAENLSGILELLLAVTMQLCSLLGRIVYFHCSLYHYEIIVHLLVFSLLYAYIYIYMTFVWVRISRILAEALGTLEETISVSFPLLDPYQSPKSLHCIRKNKPCIRKIILVLFWSNLNKHQCLKYYSSKFLNLSKWISIISLYILY